MPVIAPRLPLVAVHALLHDRPLAVLRDEEAVQIEIETVLHGGAVDLRHEAACARQGLRVESDVFAERGEFIRRAAGMLAVPAANVNSKLVLQRIGAATSPSHHAPQEGT